MINRVSFGGGGQGTSPPLGVATNHIHNVWGCEWKYCLNWRFCSFLTHKFSSASRYVWEETSPILYPHTRVKYLLNIPYLPVDAHSYVHSYAYAHGQYYLHKQCVPKSPKHLLWYSIYTYSCKCVHRSNMLLNPEIFGLRSHQKQFQTLKS